jgi:hypothetical protein
MPPFDDVGETCVSSSMQKVVNLRNRDPDNFTTYSSLASETLATLKAFFDSQAPR